MKNTDCILVFFFQRVIVLTKVKLKHKAKALSPLKTQSRKTRCITSTAGCLLGMSHEAGRRPRAMEFSATFGGVKESVDIFKIMKMFLSTHAGAQAGTAAGKGPPATAAHSSRSLQPRHVELTKWQ